MLSQWRTSYKCSVHMFSGTGHHCEYWIMIPSGCMMQATSSRTWIYCNHRALIQAEVSSSPVHSISTARAALGPSWAWHRSYKLAIREDSRFVKHIAIFLIEVHYNTSSLSMAQKHIACFSWLGEWVFLLAVCHHAGSVHRFGVALPG